MRPRRIGLEEYHSSGGIFEYKYVEGKGTILNGRM